MADEKTTTTNVCAYPGCKDPGTVLFLQKSYCSKHQGIEIEIHRLVNVPPAGLLFLATGNYKFILTDEIMADTRVAAIMPSYEKARAERLAAIVKEGKPALTADIAIKTHAKELVSQFSLNAELRKEQFYHLAKTVSLELFDEIILLFEAELNYARNKQDKSSSDKLWDSLTSWVSDHANAGTPVPEVKREILRIYYGGTTYLNMQKTPVWMGNRRHKILTTIVQRLKACLGDSDLMVAQDAATFNAWLSKYVAEQVEENKKVPEFEVKFAKVSGPAFKKEQREMETKEEKPALSARVVAGLKDEGLDTAYNIAALQGTRVLRDQIVALFMRGFRGSSREKERMKDQVVAFLNSPVGFAFVQYGTGIAITLVGGENDAAKEVARHARIQAMTAVADAGLEQFIGPLREVINNMTAGLPTGKVRVETVATEEADEVAHLKQQLADAEARAKAKAEAQQAEVASTNNTTKAQQQTM